MDIPGQSKWFVFRADANYFNGVKIIITSFGSSASGIKEVASIGEWPVTFTYGTIYSNLRITNNSENEMTFQYYCLF